MRAPHLPTVECGLRCDTFRFLMRPDGCHPNANLPRTVSPADVGAVAFPARTVARAARAVAMAHPAARRVRVRLPGARLLAVSLGAGVPLQLPPRRCAALA